MKIINVLAVTLLLLSAKTQAQRVHFGFDLGGEQRLLEATVTHLFLL